MVLNNVVKVCPMTNGGISSNNESCLHMLHLIFMGVAPAKHLVEPAPNNGITIGNRVYGGVGGGAVATDEPLMEEYGIVPMTNGGITLNNIVLGHCRLGGGTHLRLNHALPSGG